MIENVYEFSVINRIKSLRQLIGGVWSEIQHLSTEYVVRCAICDSRLFTHTVNSGRYG